MNLSLFVSIKLRIFFGIDSISFYIIYGCSYRWNYMDIINSPKRRSNISINSTIKNNRIHKLKNIYILYVKYISDNSIYIRNIKFIDYIYIYVYIKYSAYNSNNIIIVITLTN